MAGYRLLTLPFPLFSVLLLLLAAATVPLPVAGLRLAGDPGWTDTVPDANWAAAFASPNASARFAVAGFDVSQPWPGTPLDGWHVDVAVAANVSLNNSRSRLFRDGGGGIDSLTGVSIALAAPGALLVGARGRVRADAAAAQSSWDVCLRVLPPVDPALDYAGLRDADGSCAAALSAACRTALRRVAVEARGSAGGLWCGDFELPSECGDAELLSNGRFESFDITDLEALNGSTTVAYGTVNYNESYAKAQYALATQAVWPVLITWAPSNVTQLSALSQRDDSLNFSSLACVHTSQNDSHDETDPEESGGTEGLSIVPRLSGCMLGLVFLFFYVAL